VKLIVGLGNPGPKYETTRHNAGFLVLDLIAEDARATFESAPKFKGEVAKATVCGEACVLLKPMTFMNLSGQSVVAVMQFYKMTVPDIIVIHDDIDVPAGKVKMRTSGSAGGNNGIRSIIELTGREDFHRIKLGVGRPEGQDAKNWVLGKFTDAELLALQGDMLAATKLRLDEIIKKTVTN